MTLLRSASATDTGLVRSVNQDLALESPTLFAVADGMGGHAGGEVAARLAIDTLAVAFTRKASGTGLFEAVQEANAAVWDHSIDNPELRGMGTTMTAAALVEEDGRDVLALANVGDSRSYRFHEGTLTQITADHSLAEEMVRAGELTEAEAAVHPHRHILTRALGVSSAIEVDLWRIQPRRGDRYVLCSDGLTNEITDDQIREVLASVADPQEVADLLVKAARTHGGSDNITVVIFDVVVGEDDEDAPAVAAVDGDFVAPSSGESLPAPAGSVSVAEDDVMPLAGPEPLRPSWWARRRSRRKARKAARGRRLITLRSLLFVILAAGVVAAGWFVVRWYDSNAYYVGVNNNELVIYHGRVGGGVLYSPVEVQRTGVTIADVPSYVVPQLNKGVPESSLDSAQSYVANLKRTQIATTCVQNPALPICAELAKLGTATTTTVAGAVPPTTKVP
jgi:protein phosphatase